MFHFKVTHGTKTIAEGTRPSAQSARDAADLAVTELLTMAHRVPSTLLTVTGDADPESPFRIGPAWECAPFHADPNSREWAPA